jgi:CheY-like chemotaxis protein
MTLKPIWLAEDSVDDIELTLAALDKIHLANCVTVMRDGSEVLDRLEALSLPGAEPLPAVLLLDIKMPKVNGIDVLRHIKSDPSLRNLPVVMLTSSRESPDIAECYALGANAYVVKPVESSAFFQAVKTAGEFWTLFNEPTTTPMAGSCSG